MESLIAEYYLTLLRVVHQYNGHRVPSIAHTGPANGPGRPVRASRLAASFFPFLFCADLHNEVLALASLLMIRLHIFLFVPWRMLIFDINLLGRTVYPRTPLPDYSMLSCLFCSTIYEIALLIVQANVNS